MIEVRGSRSWLSLLLLTTVACGGSREPLYIPVDWSDGQVVVLLGLDEEGRPLPDIPPTVSLGAALPIAFDYDTEAAFRLVVLEYDETTGADLLRCGVRYGGDEALVPPPVRPPASALLSPSDTQAVLAEIDVEWPTLRFDTCSPDPCRDFSSELVPINARSGWTVERTLTLDERTLLVAVRGSGKSSFELTRVVDDGSDPQVISTSTGALNQLSADDQRVYIVVAADELWKLDRDSLQILDRSPIDRATVLAGRPDGPVVAFEPSGVFELSATEAPRAVDIDPLPEIDRAIFSAAGRLAAFTKEPRILYEWREGRWDPITIPSVDPVVDARFAGESLRVMTKNDLFREVSGYLERVPLIDATIFALRSIVGLGELDVYSGTGGYIGVVLEDRICNVGSGSDSLARFASLNDHLAAVGNISERSQGAFVVWVRRAVP